MEWVVSFDEGLFLIKKSEVDQCVRVVLLGCLCIALSGLFSILLNIIPRVVIVPKLILGRRETKIGGLCDIYECRFLS